MASGESSDDRIESLLIQLQRPDGSWVDVGYLHSKSEKNWFEILESYWNMARRPVLGQTFEEHGIAWQPNAHVALPHWFSHLLPEGILRRAVAQASGIKSQREFKLLATLGSADLPGAVRALPRERTAQLPDQEGSETANSDRDDPLLKFSLAGAQLKFSICADGKGLTVPAAGQAGNVVLKFPDSRPGMSGVPESELGCLMLAKLAGIDTPEAFLVDPSSVEGLEDWSSGAKGMALAVRRFDRKSPGQRVHMEELAQILNIPTARENSKYEKANFETIAVLIAALCGNDAIEDVVSRIVLNVLVGNGDAHLKNWAVVYPNGYLPSLSPVYDVLPTVLYIEHDNLGLNLAGSKIFESVTVGSFDGIGTRVGIGVSEVRRWASDSVEKILAGWQTMADYLTADQFRRLTDRRDTLALVDGRS